MKYEVVQKPSNALWVNVVDERGRAILTHVKVREAEHVVKILNGGK